LCMVTPETVRCLFDRDKVLNPLAIFEVGREDDDYRMMILMTLMKRSS
jgi:hypothetical protein